MKATKRLITLTAVVALLLSMASCALLQKKANFTQKITADNIELTIRDDMKEDPSITSKGQNYITCYFWSGYGMNVGAVEATEMSPRKTRSATSSCIRWDSKTSARWTTS